MYRYFIKKILFFFDPEKIHHFFFYFIWIIYRIPCIKKLLCSIYCVKDKRLEKKIFGITFANPVGLAAGFDKNAQMIGPLSMFGFGFIEIGTITPKNQLGQDKPRLFRLPKDEALINRMGFNNDGLEDIVKRLKKNKNSIALGINIGKNKDTPNKNIIADYLACFTALSPFASYIVVNISSPNTPGLRKLQYKSVLFTLLEQIQKINHKKIPILIKISPDITEKEIDDIITVVKEQKIAGIIATNTTISRDKLKTSQEKIHSIGMGGISGYPLKDRSTAIIKYISQKTANTIPIIASGGIMSAKDAIEKIEAGASLIQVYTGMIYKGPGLIKAINKAILKKYFDEKI